MAIVIPAYKGRFLKETLDSIAVQAHKDEFVLYIGDDASPERLDKIVESYQNKVNLVYHRFSENMGGKDLVAHWERCIQLSAEPFIWLFSDDDLMPADGVERVMEALSRPHHQRGYFFRFPLAVIDGENKRIRANRPLEEGSVSCYRLLLDKLQGKIDSAAVEYVFSREIWQSAGGFVHFPMAWCSDDATWAAFARHAGCEAPKTLRNPNSRPRSKKRATVRFKAFAQPISSKATDITNSIKTAVRLPFTSFS